MRKPDFYWAVYGIIKNNDSEILFQKRFNTWFRDWEYQLPSWHIEWKETFKQALIREMKEEINIDIKEKNIKLVHICHRISQDRVYFDLYLEIQDYSGIIKNNELNKCSEIKFINVDNIKNINLFWHDLSTLEKIKNKKYFSEIKEKYEI